MSLADTLKAAQTEEEKTSLQVFKDALKGFSDLGEGSGRRTKLNEIAYHGGAVVTEGHAHADWVQRVVYKAAEDNGLVDKYGETEVERVIGSGLEAALKTAVEKKRASNPIYARTFTSKQLKNLPPAKWTIDGVLLERSFCVVYGPPETGKSFLALDMLGCLASKNQWQGRNINGGNRPGLYIAAEGTVGLPDRVEAWEKHNETDMRDVVFYPHPIQVGMGTDWNHMLEFAEDLKPGLTVIDTLAETSGIVDEENSSTQMNKYIRNVKALMRATEGSAIVIHHTGRMGNGPRGSNALDGAADVMVKVEPGGGDRSVDVYLTKLKEGVKGGIGSFMFRSMGRSAVLVKERNLSW